MKLIRSEKSLIKRQRDTATERQRDKKINTYDKWYKNLIIPRSQTGAVIKAGLS